MKYLGLDEGAKIAALEGRIQRLERAEPTANDPT
jgi:hypothetical protein